MQCTINNGCDSNIYSTCNPNTRKYIGTRYVPQLEGFHDSNREYENFSIVTDDKNNSYTSKKNVPVGIALTDTNYWVQTGNYQAGIEHISTALSEHIKESDQDFKNIEDKLVELNTIVSSGFDSTNVKIEKIEDTNNTEHLEMKNAISNITSELNNMNDSHEKRLTVLEDVREYMCRTETVGRNLSISCNTGGFTTLEITLTVSEYKDSGFYAIDIRKRYCDVNYVMKTLNVLKEDIIYEKTPDFVTYTSSVDVDNVTSLVVCNTDGNYSATVRIRGVNI